MKILLLNPNTSDLITKKLRSEADRFSGEHRVVEVRQVTEGPVAIETAYDEVLAAYYTVKELKELEAGYDAAIIGCFADPGLAAAKGELRIPVIGFFEAAFHEVALGGSIFSVISSCGSNDIEAFTMMSRTRGIGAMLASVRHMGVGVNGIKAEQYKDIKQLVQSCISEDGAQGVILGCAAFAGFGSRLTSEIGKPVSDGVGASICLAEMLVRRQEESPADIGHGKVGH